MRGQCLPVVTDVWNNWFKEKYNEHAKDIFLYKLTCRKKTQLQAIYTSSPPIHNQEIIWRGLYIMLFQTRVGRHQIFSYVTYPTDGYYCCAYLLY